ncbi:unnamed protein product [Triticum turgidum subsp. durum]|uniref:non-specific serine/threonine protein kinase n=1 Tax=Triticum turgidum subsp. durum TaxID=4567 RepID=A0A9R0U3W9_TRITD|nr:unnamed protein product [Triticum turgidum subsp. durum]
MSSNSSSAAPPPPSKSSPPPSAAPPPSPSISNSSSPAPSSSNDPSPPPAPPKSNGAPASPARVPSPPAQSFRGSGDSSRSSQTSAHHVSPNTTAEIIFAAAGAAMLLALLIAACVCCSRRTAPRRRRKPHNPMHFYADTSGNKAGSTYYTGGPQPQCQSGIGAGPSTSTSRPPGAAWPLPPGMNSGVYSSPRDQPTSPPAPQETLGLGRGTFTYEELAAATGGFSQSNLLGQGGFGYVHKGVLPSGRAVAVKQLKSGSGQGEREFQAEVDIIGRVHHRHLVSLVGHCIAGASRMLVYEFVPNKTLEFHLHGEGLPPMAWPTRLRIALGAAKGLAYLHEDCHPRIIHRDIKSANILLDNNFEAMVADFGLAKLTYDGITHVSTRVMGTFGYLAPEYASSGKLTEKSDVYSYGVMLVELITGRRPIDATAHLVLEDGLVEWARPALSRALASAAACVRHSAKKRPKMSQIVRALEGDMSLEDLNDGVRPGQSRLFGEGAGSCSSDMNRTKVVVVASPEYSGRFGRPSPVSSDRPISDEMSPAERQQPHL